MSAPSSTQHVVRIDAVCNGSEASVRDKVNLYGVEVAAKTSEVMTAFGFSVAKADVSLATEMRDMYTKEGTGE